MTEPARVLLVEDTDHVRRMLRTMLELDGFSIAGEAADGATAVAEADRLQPDVVVVDLKMPGMDGLETAKRLKAADPARHVILYTAFAEPEVEAAAAEIGVAVCVAKTEGVSALEQEIRRLLR